MGHRCVESVLNGVLDGICIGFLFGVGLSLIRKGRFCCMPSVVAQGIDCAKMGAFIVGIFAAVRNCL